MTIALVHFNHSASNNLTVWPDMRTSPWKPNYGDMLVCAAILRQVNGISDAVRVGFGYELKKPVDQAIIRGSTYLHKNFDFDAANKTLDSIDAPLAIVGLGAQSPTFDPKLLDGHEAAKGFIARLNDRSASISVRGAYTGNVVERLGGKNIRVTGCPSLFYTLGVQPVTVPELLKRPERSLGVSLHTGLMKNIFCSAPQQARHKHGQVIAWAIENAANLSLFEQGVLLEYDAADRSLPFEQRLEAATEIIQKIGAQGKISPQRLMAHMVSVKSIEEWLSKARDLDGIIGFRFHGNMVALLQGKPCYYYAYDSRLTEFCQLYDLPYQQVTDDWQDPVTGMVEHDWKSTHSAISKCFTELKEFYRENNFSVTFT